jgi:gamma-glutamyl hydrolase
MTKRVVVIVLLFLLHSLSITESHNAPIIGILSEPIINQKNNETEFMIAASYVKWLEMSGARSVAIPFDANVEQINMIFSSIDGLLFPGGAGKILPDSARYLWKLAKGTIGFPIWGTCLGFEYLIMLASEDDFILEGGFDAENISLPLTLYNRSKNNKPSELYRKMNMTTIQSHNVSMNNHLFGITPSKFASNINLMSIFRITSTSQDRNGRWFVSTIEPQNSSRFPYFGVQYHPEKNTFEYATYPGTDIPFEDIPHETEALELSRHLGLFFVQQVRIQQSQMKRQRMIFTKIFPPIYTYERRIGLQFQEYYIIPKATTYFRTIISKE